jgi:hypothetical protein
MNSTNAVAESFNLDGFSALSFSPRSVTRNFPLQVEGYDLSGPIHYVHGVDLSSGTENRRVRVFLRDMTPAGLGGARVALRDYATDPYLNLSDADLRDRKKMEEISQSLEAKCFTPASGVLMVQSAFDDPAIGAVSAYWVNRVIADGADLAANFAAIVSPALARICRPVFPRSADAGKTYCACDVLHPEKGLHARSKREFEDHLFNVLSTSPTNVPGKALAVIRLIQTSTGQFNTQLLERRAEKVAPGRYKSESPVATIERLWSSMSPAFASGLRAALESGAVEAMIVPGTRYRLVGKALEALERPANKRPSLPWERFSLPENGRESGYMNATVALLRHRGKVDQGDEDFFTVGVWPMTNEEAPVSLQSLVL